MQDQLRQIKRDVNGEMKGIRDDYRDRSAAAASITSAALSILGKRQKAGQVRADRKRQLRAERNTVLASYEALRTVIDRAIKELNGMKAGPERLIQQAEATGREGEKKAEAVEVAKIERHKGGYQAELSEWRDKKAAYEAAEAERVRQLEKARQDYVAYIHAIGFRLIGEVFYVLPGIESLVISGFVEIDDGESSYLERSFLTSSRLSRQRWEGLDFEQLEQMDVVACFERFETRRSITKDGALSPVEPFEG